MWEDHPDFKNIRRRILRRYAVRLSPFINFFLLLVFAATVPSWRYPIAAGIQALWFGIVLLHFVGLIFMGIVNRAARREFEREYGREPLAKPKRERIARLSDDGEVLDDEREWEDSRSHNRAT